MLRRKTNKQEVKRGTLEPRFLPDTEPNDELRYRIRRHVKNGCTVIAAAKIEGVSLSTAFRAYWGEFKYFALIYKEEESPGIVRFLKLVQRLRLGMREFKTFAGCSTKLAGKYSAPVGEVFTRELQFEEKILPLIKEGFRDFEIARKLGLSVYQIRTVNDFNGYKQNEKEIERAKHKKQRIILHAEACFQEQKISKIFGISPRSYYILLREAKNNKEKSNDTLKKRGRRNFFIRKKQKKPRRPE